MVLTTGSGRSSLITLSFRLSDSRSHENKQRIMMVDFKWIQVALFLAAVLQFSAVSEGRELITREGERVVLPCDNVLQDQHGCGFTSWTVSEPGQAAKEVVQHGKIEPDEEHRLEMMKNCSLVIKKVTVKDVRLYTCQQYRDSNDPQQSGVFLSVVSITQEQSGNMEINCSVRTDEICRFTVRWWFNGQKAVETPPSTCSAIFPKTSQTKGSYECEVTDGVNKKLFPFSPRASGEEPEETPTKPATTKPATTKPATTKPATSKPATSKPATAKPATTKPATTKLSPEKTTTKPAPEVKGLLLPSVIVPLVLAALVVIVVMVIRWKRAKGNKTQINQRDGLNSNPAEAQPSPGRGQEMADAEDGLSYATISFNKNKASRSKAKVLGQDDDDDDGTVTYSRVKPGNDFSNMYATVNKPNK